MKKFFLSALLLCCFDATAANEWSSLSLAPKTSLGQPFITFIFKGEVFVPPVPVEKANGPVDHSSPEALARSLFRALNERNAQIYADVYNTTPDKVAYTPSEKNVVSAMTLHGRLLYDDVSVLLLDITLPKWKGTVPICVRRQQGGYFGLLPEPKDPALTLLTSYVDYGMNAADTVDFTNRYTFEQNRHIYFTNFLSGSDKNPLIIGFSGENLSLADPIAVDPHTSPEAVLRSAVAYAAIGQTNAYLDLIAPNEVTRETADRKSTIERYVCDRVPAFTQTVRTGFKMRWKISSADLEPVLNFFVK